MQNGINREELYTPQQAGCHALAEREHAVTASPNRGRVTCSAISFLAVRLRLSLDDAACSLPNHMISCDARNMATLPAMTSELKQLRQSAGTALRLLPAYLPIPVLKYVRTICRP